MLGIGCPDRHALQRITSPKLRRPRRCSPPASGFVPRRNLVVAAHSGEVPITVRFADLRHRALQKRCLLKPRGHALASRLRGSWMEARVTVVAAGFVF